jgi:hypothetical protein
MLWKGGYFASAGIRTPAIQPVSHHYTTINIKTGEARLDMPKAMLHKLKTI